jgi:hypothetical protein
VRFLGFAALIGLSLSILRVSTAASADQCPQKESPFRTDRPDVTNSSLVVPQGSFQSENGINFSQREGNHEFDGTNSRLRWGIAPCLEGQSAALGLGRVKTKSDLVVMPSGRQIFAFFYSPRDRRAQNSGCGYTA